MTKRVALYTRVSTSDGQQTIDNQLETSKNCWLTAAWRDSLAFAMSGGGNDRAARFL